MGFDLADDWRMGWSTQRFDQVQGLFGMRPQIRHKHKVVICDRCGWL